MFSLSLSYKILRMYYIIGQKEYVYSHYNMCYIPINFCNIDIQHLQHTSETLETYVLQHTH
jgi:hypothetical protein